MSNVPIPVSVEVLTKEMLATERPFPMDEFHPDELDTDDHDWISMAEAAERFPIVDYPPYTDAEQVAGFEEFQIWDGSAPYGLGK